MKLTAKQERFAQLIAEGNTQVDAYRIAYDQHTLDANQAYVRASKLAANAKIVIRIDDLRAKAAKKHEVTVDTITGMLAESYKLARQKDMPSAAVAASMGLAKLHGLIVEKKADVTAERHTDDLDARIRQLLADIKEDDARGSAGEAADSGSPEQAGEPLSSDGPAPKGTVH